MKFIKRTVLFLIPDGGKKGAKISRITQAGFPALSPEAAEWIRMSLPDIKAVAIDTLSIENITQGYGNGFLVHTALLDPARSHHTVRIIEDINPQH